MVLCWVDEAKRQKAVNGQQAHTKELAGLADHRSPRPRWRTFSVTSSLQFSSLTSPNKGINQSTLPQYRTVYLARSPFCLLVTKIISFTESLVMRIVFQSSRVWQQDVLSCQRVPASAAASNRPVTKEKKLSKHWQIRWAHEVPVYTTTGKTFIKYQMNFVRKERLH